MSNMHTDVASSQNKAEDKVAVDVRTLTVATTLAAFTGTVPNLDPVEDVLHFVQYTMLVASGDVTFRAETAPTRRFLAEAALNGVPTKGLRKVQALFDMLSQSKTPHKLARAWLVTRVKVTRDLNLRNVPRAYVDRLPVNWDPETAAAYQAVRDLVKSVLANRDPGVDH